MRALLPGPRAKFGPVTYARELPPPMFGGSYAPTPGWWFQGLVQCRKVKSKERGFALLGVFARCCKDCRRPFTTRCSLLALEQAGFDGSTPGPLELRRCPKCKKARKTPAGTAKRAAEAREKTRLRVAKHRAIRDLIG